ncbi:MAG TPA: tetratricopeptide repeat protein [bacterium]|nr:tetratricopeptide repeat protein [bacterium]
MRFRRFFPVFFALLAFCPKPGRADQGLAQALSRAAQANDDSGRPYLALYDLDKALGVSPEDPELWRASARLMFSTGHPALARERWLRVIELLPGDREAAAALQDLSGPPAMPVSVPKVTPAPGLGLGLWMSGGSRAQVDTVNVYNSKAPEGQHVRYLFVLSGKWILDGPNSRWDLDLDQALMAADELGGDSSVYVWINGDTQGAENVDPVTWERLAGELVDQVQVKHHLGGVFLNPRCCGAALYPLEDALRRRLTVPLAVETGAADAADFDYADFLVLRPLPPKGDAASYAGRVRDLTAGFLGTAQAVGGKAMIGLSGLGGPPVTDAENPSQWYTQGRQAVAAALPKNYDSFLGVAVWGLVADDEGGVFELAPDVWTQMQLPVERR